MAWPVVAYGSASHTTDDSDTWDERIFHIVEKADWKSGAMYYHKHYEVKKRGGRKHKITV